MSILDKIKGPYVEIAGWLLGLLIAVFFFGNPSDMLVIGLLLFYSLTRMKPSIFNFLKSFAEPTTWPSYVTLGVVIIIAAYHGGIVGLGLAGAMLMMNDGRTFDSLY